MIQLLNTISAKIQEYINLKQKIVVMTMKLSLCDPTGLDYDENRRIEFLIKREILSK